MKYRENQRIASLLVTILFVSFLYKVIYACISPATTQLRIIDGLDQFVTE